MLQISSVPANPEDVVQVWVERCVHLCIYICVYLCVCFCEWDSVDLSRSLNRTGSKPSAEITGSA